MQDHRSAQGVAAPQGFTAGAVACEIKEGSTKPDLGAVLSSVPAVAAGVFTQNKAAAAPVLLNRERIRMHRASVIIANSGNANACNGPQGLEDARHMAADTARRFQVPEDEVLVLSTGVIGVPMPMNRIAAGISRLTLARDGGADFAHAIMTTDTRRKTAAVELTVDGVPVVIGGAAKGSGMIHPNMATLLGFITTDAKVAPEFLQAMLARAADRSFNAISVDGDTSTNDSVIALANGAAGTATIDASHPEAGKFADAFTGLCIDLAKQLARDGEGARTLITVQVSTAANDVDARQVARAITASSLVKTAVFGADPNWGRIVCAAGYAGAAFDPDRATLHLEDICLFKHGTGLPYAKDDASALLRRQEVTIHLDLGLGNGAAEAWGCDMSYEYVRINAEYTT